MSVFAARSLEQRRISMFLCHLSYRAIHSISLKITSSILQLAYTFFISNQSQTCIPRLYSSFPLPLGLLRLKPWNEMITLLPTAMPAVQSLLQPTADLIQTSASFCKHVASQQPLYLVLRKHSAPLSTLQLARHR